MVLSSTPVGAAGGSSVELSLGGEGSTSWSVEGIAPGDRGSKEVVLQNIGSKGGTVLIWIGNIEETDAAGDGAFLGRYLWFSIDAEGLCTEVRFPCTIYDLPGYPSSKNKILIDLPAGSSVTLHWTWEFLETGAPQNEAQGDRLSFDINYLLYEAPPEDEAYQWVLFDVLGRETVVGVNSTGYVTEEVQAADPSGSHRITVPKGTRIVTEGGQVPSAVIMTVATDQVRGTAPDGWTVAGPIYVLSGYLEDTGTVDVLFIGKAGLTLAVDPSSVPEGTKMTSVFMLTADDRWTGIGGSSTSTSSSWEAWGTVDRTGTYAVLISGNASGRAFFEARDLTVQPEASGWWPIPLATSTGRTVSVGATLTNHGDIAGSYVVSLIVDGDIVDSKPVELMPGESREVVLTASGLSDGEHQVRMAGLAGSFRTETAIDWPSVLMTAVALWLPMLLPAARRGHAPSAVLGGQMDDHKGRVLRELARAPLPFKELSLRTGMDDGTLVRVLEELWKEGHVGTVGRAEALYFTDLRSATAEN